MDGRTGRGLGLEIQHCATDWHFRVCPPEGVQQSQYFGIVHGEANGMMMVAVSGTAVKM